MIKKRSINKIACVGEVMIELVMDGPADANIGVAGDTYNTAVYLSRLLRGQNKSVSYVTALGLDRFSARIFDHMKRHNVDASYVERRPDLMPGLYAIDTDDAGERSFTYWRSQAAARSLFAKPCQIKLNALNDFDLIYVSGITMAVLPPDTRTALIEFLTTYRENGGYVVYDSNYRPRLWEDLETAQTITMDLWRLADIALPSLGDEMDLFQEENEAQVTERLHEAGVTFGALKRGSNGPLS